MKCILISLILASATLPLAAGELPWFTDVQAAQEKAKREHKYVLLDFTGSDWCGWCMKLKSEVFDQPEFAAFAADRLVMVEVDFPRHKAQTPEQVKIYRQLADTLQVTGFPTIYLLNSEGAVTGKTGYLPGGPKPFITELSRIMGTKPPVTTPDAEPEPPRKPFVYVPAPVVAPVRYEGLALKGLSGSKDRRLALINNQTLMVGETAKVKVQDARLEVFCKEIRDDSVSITVDGKPMELRLNGQ